MIWDTGTPAIPERALAMFQNEIQRTWVWDAVWAAEQLHTSEKIALHSP